HLKQPLPPRLYRWRPAKQPEARSNGAGRVEAAYFTSTSPASPKPNKENRTVLASSLTKPHNSFAFFLQISDAFSLLHGHSIPTDAPLPFSRVRYLNRRG